jgi:hypothetical protein
LSDGSRRYAKRVFVMDIDACMSTFAVTDGTVGFHAELSRWRCGQILGLVMPQFLDYGVFGEANAAR